MSIIKFICTIGYVEVVWDMPTMLKLIYLYTGLCETGFYGTMYNLNIVRN